MILFDSILLVSTLLISFSIRLGYWYFPGNDLVWVIFCSPIIAIPIFLRFGLYNEIIRYIGFKALTSVAQAVSLYALIWGIICFMVAIDGIPRSVILINCILGIVLIGGSRMLARELFSDFIDSSISNNVIIYGAGSAGRQLENALSQSVVYNPVAFIDDSAELNKQVINGIKVYSPENIGFIVNKYNVSELYVSISIYDLNGYKVKSLTGGSSSAGFHSVQWDATNDLGEIVSAGMYFFTLKTNQFNETIKMLFLK